MAFIGLTVTEGLQQVQLARDNQGWDIFPTKFGVSDTAGTFSIARTMADRNPEWFQGLNGGYNILSDIQMEILGTIPPGQNGNLPTTIAELYYYAEGKQFTFTVDFNIDNQLLNIPSELGSLTLFITGKEITLRVSTGGTLPAPFIVAQTYFVRKLSSTTIKLAPTKADAIAGTNLITFTTNGSGTLYIQMEFLLSIAKPIPAVPYNPDQGNYNLRPSFVLANAGDPNLFNFIYTQAQDISIHNLDPAAHPAIQSALNIAGIFPQIAQHEYNGQLYDQLPVFEVGVVEFNALYIKANGKYEKAVADGSIAETNFIGVRKDGIVYTRGFVDIGTHGFTVGAKLYLHATTPGAFTTSATNKEVGKVINSTTIYLDFFFTAISGITTFLGLTDTPADYTGDALKRVRVNTGETALEFIDDSFLNLQDTPNAYTGEALKLVRVNDIGGSNGNALEFVDPNTFLSSGALRIIDLAEAAYNDSLDVSTEIDYSNDKVTVSPAFYGTVNTGDIIIFDLNGTGTINLDGGIKYFAIKTGAGLGTNEIAFATTEANAFADVKLNITNAGVTGSVEIRNLTRRILNTDRIVTCYYPTTGFSDIQTRSTPEFLLPLVGTISNGFELQLNLIYSTVNSLENPLMISIYDTDFATIKFQNGLADRSAVDLFLDQVNDSANAQSYLVNLNLTAAVQHTDKATVKVKYVTADNKWHIIG